MRLAFWRRPKPAHDEILAELDRDIKGRPAIYIDGAEVPDRRRDRRPPPVSPGRRAEDPLDDPFPVPFVPRPVDESSRGEMPQ